MKFIVIENGGMQNYILDVFHRYSGSGFEIGCFAMDKPKRSKIEDISVIDISDIAEYEYDAVLIAVKSNSRLQRLLHYLYEKKINNIYVITLYALDKKLDFLSEKKINERYVHHLPTQDSKPYLVHLETHVCDHCNLNCKACNNFAPFVKEATCTNIVQFEQDMLILSRLFSNIGRLFLLGGEPLLEPELCCEMIRICRQFFPNAELRLLTNALLIPQMTELFWECLREHQVIVHISVYPPVIPNLPNIESVLQRNQIEYLLVRIVETFGKHWTLHSLEDKVFNNEHCGSRGCHYLREGILSKCPDGILIGYMAQALNCTPEELQSHRNIRLSEDGDPWEIIKMLESPSDLCQKCTFQRQVRIPWEQIGASVELSDWLLENRMEYENRILSEKISTLSEERETMTIELQNIQGRMREAELEIAKWQTKAADKENELKNRVDELSDKESKLAASQAELERANEKIHEWNVKLTKADHNLQEKEKQLNWLNGEYERVLNSISYHVGRGVTWCPRKVRKGIKAIWKNRRGTE